MTAHTGSGSKEIVKFLFIEGSRHRPVCANGCYLRAFAGDDLRPVEGQFGYGRDLDAVFCRNNFAGRRIHEVHYYIFSLTLTKGAITNTQPCNLGIGVTGFAGSSLSLGGVRLNGGHINGQWHMFLPQLLCLTCIFSEFIY